MESLEMIAGMSKLPQTRHGKTQTKDGFLLGMSAEEGKCLDITYRCIY